MRLCVIFYVSYSKLSITLVVLRKHKNHSVRYGFSKHNIWKTDDKLSFYFQTKDLVHQSQRWKSPQIIIINCLKQSERISTSLLNALAAVSEFIYWVKLLLIISYSYVTFILSLFVKSFYVKSHSNLLHFVKYLMFNN